MCVGRHLDEQGMHLHLETHTPVTHVQTQMKHNSFPQVSGMKVGLVSVNQDAGSPPVSLLTLSCDHPAAQCVLQVLRFFGQVMHNQVPTGCYCGIAACKGKNMHINRLPHVSLSKNVLHFRDKSHSVADSEIFLIIHLKVDIRIANRIEKPD